VTVVEITALIEREAKETGTVSAATATEEIAMVTAIAETVAIVIEATGTEMTERGAAAVRALPAATGTTKKGLYAQPPLLTLLLTSSDLPTLARQQIPQVSRDGTYVLRYRHNHGVRERVRNAKQGQRQPATDQPTTRREP
jgi:hypothetical protein